MFILQPAHITTLSANTVDHKKMVMIIVDEKTYHTENFLTFW